MSTQEPDGSAVLEKLAELGKLDDFMDAIDRDDFASARRLLRSLLKYPEFAQVQIDRVMRQIHEATESDN